MRSGEPGREVRPRDRAAWRRWLALHHADSPAVWLVIRKKGASAASVSYEEAVEEALCFGWIDSKANPVDDEQYKIWMSPRKRGSGWSAVNKRRIDRLTAAGMMAPAGLAAIDAAKKDGSWGKLDASHALRIPKDLASAFRKHPGSKRHFEAFPPSTRRAILAWIDAAKKAETRAQRIDRTASLAADNIRANEWSRET